jgi:hypothetical protein
MSAFRKRHRLRYQVISHRDELKTKPAFRKYYQLCGELVVRQVVVRRHDLQRKSVLRKHYQLWGELAVSRQTSKMYDIPDGIIAHLTRECGGNVHDRNVADVTPGSSSRSTSRR